MNKDIKIMVELQGYWDKVLASRKEAALDKGLIQKGLENVANKKKEMIRLETETKKKKASVNEMDITLTQKDEKVRTLDDRVGLLTTEKEISALGNEVLMLNEERGELEEKLILEMDDLSSLEKRLALMKSEFSDLEKQTDDNKGESEEKIASYVRLESENREKFNDKIDDLSKNYKSRFINLLESKDGMAIAPIESKTCEGCKVKIPEQVISDAASGIKIYNCTNCGKFIYIKE